MSKFASPDNPSMRGFYMTFANGWSVSVQWGLGNYGSNQHTKEGRCPYYAKTAEVAIILPNGSFLDDVYGYQTTDNVAAIIANVAAKPTMEHLT